MGVYNFDRTLNAFKNRKPSRPSTEVLVNDDCVKIDFLIGDLTG
jgi:hypothetical protein